MMCSCCRNQFSEDKSSPKRELFCGSYASECGNSRGIFAPVCEKCYEAYQAMQAAKESGEISKAEYTLYEDALYRALAHGLLVEAFVRNPKLQDAMMRLRVLDY